MERAIGIIKREIEKRKSMLMNEEYFLRINQIKCEIKSLDKALDVVNKNYLLQRVSDTVYDPDWEIIQTAPHGIQYKHKKTGETKWE